MKVVRGYKTELDLNNEQRTACLKHAGANRFAYNWGLARSKEVYRASGKRPTAIDLHRELNALKRTDYPWMYEVSKCAPQEALRDLEKAYKNFFRRVDLKSQGKWRGKLGFPKFKKRCLAIGSFRLTGSIKVESDAVQLPRLGRLRLHEHGFIPTDGKILSATVSEQAGRWFVSVQMEVEQEQPTPTATSAIGVDLGIKTLATMSDGSRVDNPRALKHAEMRVIRLERQKARRKLGGKNRKKTRLKLAKQHAHVANIRKDASHNLTTNLCKNHALVGIEDLHIAGMLKNHKLAQAVADTGMGEIRRQLEYKASRSGVHLVVIDRWFPSSKMCSACGWIDEDQDLSDRVFICQECGLVIDRDLNAATNILHEAIGTTGSFSESDAYGQGSSGNVNGHCETALGEIGTNHLCGVSTNV
jgi:putative transposase